MKYIKKYKVFEAIHPNNTNIKELSVNFVNDIIDICADLNDQFPQYEFEKELVTFYSSNFRSRCNNHIPDYLPQEKEPFSNYPSISISMPYFSYGYTFGDKNIKHRISKDCDELKEVALRIKEFLGDAYIAFVIPDGHGSKTIKLNNDTTLFSGINGFQIVYDQNKIS